MMSHKEYLNLLQETVTRFHNEEILPNNIPNVQHQSLLPTLRPYQIRAVKWMMARELFSDIMDQGFHTKLPSGGILADEMGLGKTVEVLACILANPRESYVNNLKEENITTKICFNEGENPSQNEKNVEDGDIAKKPNRKRVQFNNDCLEIPVKQFKYDFDDQRTEDTVSKTIEDVIKKHCSSAITECKDDIEIIEDTVIQTIEEVIEKHCHKKKEKKIKAVGGVRSMLQSWYDYKLLEMSPHYYRQKPASYYNSFIDVKCCCVKEVEDDETVQCPVCRTYQHTSCVGYTNREGANEYFCFNCWKDQPPVRSSATVIISPESICNQWTTEIEKHIKKDDLKVLVYNGVRVNGYIQPPDLAQYDLVITTYEVLRKEIYFADIPTEGRQLRHAKRFFAPTSPLTCIQWWRLCLDEAQMVEGITTKTAEMAKKFNVIHKWAVTGTPIQKSVHDLHGLIEFLNIKPYSDLNEWKELVNNTDSFLKFLPRVLWRTAKKDVMQELGVPEQKMVQHWLEFSPVEMYFYQTQHTECSSLFLQKVTRFKDLNITLNSIDRRLVNGLMLPLLRIRQACSHPQAVRGQFVSIKKTMTMGDLLLNMVDKAKLDCEEVLRQMIASLNGIAGLNIIQGNILKAIEAYRAVMHLIMEHDKKLKVDSLQKIHTLHNLSEVLEMNPGLVAPTLRDDQLNANVADLEKNYLDKREYSIKSIKESVDKYATNIEELSKGKTLGYSEWWLNVLENTEDHEELLNKLKTPLERVDILHQHQHNNLSRKLHSLPAVRIELAKWLGKTDSCRQNVLCLLKMLETTSKDDLATMALICHLPSGSSMKKISKCQLCKCESALKHYETLIFEERSKSKRKQTERSKTQKQTEDFNIAQKSKGLADLVDVNLKTSEISNKGGLKASQHERVLKSLKSYGRSKHMASSILQDATKHLKLLDLIKKEFLYLNNYWTQISEQVLARDELNMAKQRLRLPLPGELDEEKKKKTENRHIVKPFKVPIELYNLESEKAQSEEKFKLKMGTLLYLQNLQRDDNSVTTCPICRNNLSDKWSVMHCGHCICLECLPVMLKQARSSLSCVQCRQQCAVKDISYVMNSESKESQLKGSHSTKVEAVVTKILSLREEDPCVKILVFSSWDKVLDVIAECFEMNDIEFRKLVPGKAKTALKDFKTKDIMVLLLSLRYGAKGLNLIEATHVFLVEPILNPSDELQAIGRVHRIGQTRETFVHRFIVKETIEERMLSAVEASGADQWSKEEITLKQLFDLFTLNSDTLGNVSEEQNTSNIVNEPNTSQTMTADNDHLSSTSLSASEGELSSDCSEDEFEVI